MSDTLLVIALVLPSLVIVLTGLFLWTVARRRQTQVTAPPEPPQPIGDPNGLDSLLQSMSQRLAACEGRLGAQAAELQTVAILGQRLSAVETNMPGLQEAYEKYGDQVARADKRATERDRTEKKTAGFQTAGEAADLIAGAGAGGNPAPTQLAPAQNNRAGVRGRGRGGKYGAGN